MTTFDLVDALAGAPVVTRDGRRVLDLVWLRHAYRQPVVAVIEGEDEPRRYDTAGHCTLTRHPTPHDLFMSPGSPGAP